MMVVQSWAGCNLAAGPVLLLGSIAGSSVIQEESGVGELRQRTVAMTLYGRCLRPFLFRLDPELQF